MSNNKTEVPSWVHLPTNRTTNSEYAELLMKRGAFANAAEALHQNNKQFMTK